MGSLRGQIYGKKPLFILYPRCDTTCVLAVSMSTIFTAQAFSNSYKGTSDHTVGTDLLGETVCESPFIIMGVSSGVKRERWCEGANRAGVGWTSIIKRGQDKRLAHGDLSKLMNFV